MNNELAKHLSHSVADFYQTHGQAFANTRGMGWKEMELAATLAKPGMVVIDVGAGNGRFADQLPSGIDYLGIEPSASLRAARPDLNLIEGQLPNLPVADASSDLTVCFAVFHHLTKPEREAAIQELLRITKPGGHIVVSSWFLNVDDYESVEDGDPGDIWVPWHAEGADAKRYVHIFNLEEWKKLFNIPQLHISQIGYFGKNDWTTDPKEARNLLIVGQKP